MNVTLNITSVPDQEAFLVDATTVTPSGHRWIEAKALEEFVLILHVAGIVTVLRTPDSVHTSTVWRPAL